MTKKNFRKKKLSSLKLLSLSFDVIEMMIFKAFNEKKIIKVI
jgi:hypothetical protein